MLLNAIDIVGILVLILPGFLAYRFVLQRRVDPTQRSPIWQISEILEYSTFVHIIGVGLAFVVVWLLKSGFGITTHAPELFQNRPNDFLEKYFAEGILWFTLYALYVVVASSVIGAYDFPGRVSAKIVEGVSFCALRMSKIVWLGWMPIPNHPYPPEPIWYLAFNPVDEQSVLDSNSDRKSVTVIVTLKSGSIYVGEMASYPIVSDTQSEKDFLIRRADYYRDGDISRDDENLEELDSDIDTVLLNTVNIDSIRLYYDESES